MANTYVKIASVSVGVLGASTMEFTSIPATYTDLLVKVSGRTTNAATSDSVLFYFNGLTTNQTMRRLQGDGSVASSTTSTASQFVVVGATATASTFGNAEIYVPNYAGSNNKSFSIDAVREDNATATNTQMWAGLWSSSAAITQITIAGQSTNFVQYSTATLYGIKSTQEKIMTTAIEVNCATGEVTERELTAAELEQREADAAAYAAAKAEEDAAAEAAAAAKASGQAKLAALGLTADEIAALSK